MNAVAGLFFIGMLGAYLALMLAVKKKTPAGAGASALTPFVFVSAPFFVVCCSGAPRVKSRISPAGILQLMLFVFACYLGVRQDAFSRRLISPVSIGLGLVAGHLIFGLSLLITQRSVRDAAAHFIDFPSLWEFGVEHPAVLMQFVSVGVAEELIYRVGAQPVLVGWAASPLVGILVVALAFSCAHEHFFKNPFGQSLEFFLFAVVLGALYYWTSSLILVIVVHAVRNIEIAFLEHLIRADELGGEDQAARETEYLSGERILVMLVLAAREICVSCFEYSGSRIQVPAAPKSGGAGVMTARVGGV